MHLILQYVFHLYHVAETLTNVPSSSIIYMYYVSTQSLITPYAFIGLGSIFPSYTKNAKLTISLDHTLFVSLLTTSSQVVVTTYHNWLLKQ